MSRIRFFLNYSPTIRKRIKDNPEYFKNRYNVTSVFITYAWRKNQFRSTTGIEVNPNNWDKKAQRINTGDPQHINKNRTLNLLESRIRNILNEAIYESKPLTHGYLKEKFSLYAPGENLKNEKSFAETWKHFIDNSNDKGELTIKNYKYTLKHILKFSKDKNIDIALHKINMDFYEKLMNYFFKELKITRNTAGKHIKNLKAFLSYCNKKGYTGNTEYKSFKITKDRQIINYLKPDEIQKLYSYQFTNEKHEKVKDIFLFSCFTGLRYSDLMKITKENIQGGNIDFIITKTDKLQSTPIHPKAMEIFNKYPGRLPRITNQECNRILKEIGEMVGLNRSIIKIRYIGNNPVEQLLPIYNFISMHMAKRTFVMSMVNEDIPMDIIMETTGNKDRETMKAYYEIRNEDKARAINKTFDFLKD